MKEDNLEEEKENFIDTHENENKEQKQNENETKKKEKAADWVDVDEKAKKELPKDISKKVSKEIKDIEGYGMSPLKEIRCKVVPNNEISKCDNIEIKIDNYEKIEGKLFSKSYIIYTIVTLPLNWKVRRRFSDCEWLHQILVNNYNYCFIPGFQKKKNINKLAVDKFDKGFLRKRMRSARFSSLATFTDPPL